MKIVADILIALREDQKTMARQHLLNANSSESLLALNGMYRGIEHAIEVVERTLADEDDRQANL
jgi:hypothetical protein